MPEWVWRVAEPLPERFLTELGEWPSPLRQLLYNRGLRSRTEVQEFLDPDRSAMHDPFMLMGMDIAVDRIYRALREQELIAVYGDFDVDGLTAAALLVDVLRGPSLQGNVTSYLPHRSREGYGLNNDAIRSLAERGTRLLITVDCGIGADSQIAYATALGLDVIVTDHHQISQGVPPALAVLNARQDGCGYPFKELSGVGMAYKLAEALFSRIWGLEAGRERLKPYMDLVALGVIADVAPLIGENRFLVKEGLRQIALGNRIGLKALLKSAGWGDRQVDADAVSYVIAPRLNAAGRMGDARASFDLLLCESAVEAARTAQHLEETNRSRQTATAQALAAARQDIQSLPQLPPAIVVAGDYPAGIVGLVAAKLADDYRRPAFVVEIGDDGCRGSGRGVAGFDVVSALAACSDLLTRFGGHSQAGGFALATADLEAFRERIEAVACEQIGSQGASRELRLDGELLLSDVGPTLHRQLLLLEPHGAGNSRPVFCSRGLRVRDYRTVGNGHLKLWLFDQSASCSAIGFGMGNGSKPFVQTGASIDCAYTISRDERNGMVSYELNLKDLRPSSPAFNVL